MSLLFCTTNSQKLAKGAKTFHEYGLELVQKPLDIDEVQSENSVYVATKKAEAAFAQLQKPVVISDDSWAIPGLNGFPGTYAKSINTWFTPDDYIRLTRELTDRRVILTQILVYQDKDRQKLFQNETTGTLLLQPQGTTGATIQKVVSFEPDGRSISEVIGTGTHYSSYSTMQVWHQLAAWYKENKA